MRIGFFTDTYFPNVDGVVTAMASYRRELEARGNPVFVFASGDAKAKNANVDPHVYFFDSVTLPQYPQYKLAFFPINITSKARKARLDVVHSHAVTTMGLASIKAAKDLGLPLVGTFHTMVPIAVKYYTRKNKLASLLADRFLWGAIRAFYKPFDLVTAPTQTVRRILEEKGIEKTFVVPNGVDTARYHPKLDRRPVRTMLGLKPDEKLFLVAGRVSMEKNIDMVVRACKLLDEGGEDFHLVITGDGPAFDPLKALVHKLGLEKRIRLIGFCHYFELPYYYAAADAFVTASTFETQGLAMLEAMACGKPVIGADSLAIPDSVKDGSNGYLFRPHDAAGCAEKMRKILHASPARTASLSAQARATAERVSVEKSTAKLLDAYSLVL